MKIPFVLSLSKDAQGPWFDRLTTNGGGIFILSRGRSKAMGDSGGKPESREGLAYAYALDTGFRRCDECGSFLIRLTDTPPGRRQFDTFRGGCYSSDCPFPDTLVNVAGD